MRSRRGDPRHVGCIAPYHEVPPRPRSQIVRIAVLLLFALPAFAAEPPKFIVKVAKAEPPKALAEELRTTLDEQTVIVLNGDGTSRAQFWLRKETPVRANDEQVK